jgi:hypothetical protein
LLTLVGLALPPDFVTAQDGGDGATQETTLAGIEIDADGVLKTRSVKDPAWGKMRRKIAEAKTSLPTEVGRRSEMRKISLNRLEAAVAERLGRGEQPTDEMRYLAGLMRVQYVMAYPETNDIILAGPAEGWVEDLVGRVRGVYSGSPVIELQDLVVALRAFPPGGQETPVISCSIDPTKEGLASMQAFLNRIGSRATPNYTQFIVNGLRESLGLQIVSIRGIPADTHFAQILVEADYRMKLIGIGLERPRAPIESYVKLASKTRVSRNAMQRWYFVPNYECVRLSEDGLGIELVGNGVKLIGADEMVTADGTRVEAAKADKAGRMFTQGFTEKYPGLAAKEPIYAQLRNMIDLSVAAAFLQREDLYGRVGWHMHTFSDETQVPVQTARAVARVETAVASFWSGNRLMTPIGGGVRIEASKAFDEENLITDGQAGVTRTREEISLDHLKPGQWWWD